MKKPYQTSLTVERLRDLLDYDAETGVFRWKVDRRGGVRAGDVTGCLCKRRGYLLIGIDNVVHLAHRLAWLWMTGAWPEEQIDHRNGIRNDNRFLNLRSATHSENCQNIKKDYRNTSGYLGVYFYTRHARFVATIKKNGIQYHLGYFDTAKEAGEVYLAAKAQLHPFQPVPRDT